MIRYLTILVIGFFLSPCIFCNQSKQTTPSIHKLLPEIHDSKFTQIIDATIQSHQPLSGVFVLNRGHDSLVARAYLGEQANKTMDIQYFIWSEDNIGILATESLLRAADRGVHVRILVDDFLMKANAETLIALAAHPQIEIKIYNPKYNVGTNFFKRYLNLSTKFVESNQRMHNKTFIVDGKMGITGGRNMADEYFDFDHEYNFRDRDVLLLGPVVKDMTASFEQFWQDSRSVSIENIFEKGSQKLPEERIQSIYADLHAYSQNIDNYDDDNRNLLLNLPKHFQEILEKTVWDRLEFVSDHPGKNTIGTIDGGGLTTKFLADAINTAKENVIIQSPYLVISDIMMSFFQNLIKRGVKIEIVTNSLASTDNLFAYSGYIRKKDALTKMGILIYEYKDHPEIFKTIFANEKFKSEPLVFAIHAKTLVVDHDKVFVGTFNLDPRSANLNTECGVFIQNKSVASLVEQDIRTDMLPENSWKSGDPAIYQGVPFFKKLKLKVLAQFDLEPIL